MDNKEIESLPSKNLTLAEFTELPEMCLYQALSALYARFYAKKITKDTAHIEKNKIIKAYQNYRSEYDRYRNVYIERERIIREGYRGAI